MAPEHLSSRKNSGMLHEKGLHAALDISPFIPTFLLPRAFLGLTSQWGPLTNTKHPSCQVDSCPQLSILRQARRGSPPLCSHPRLKNFIFHSLNLLGLPLPPPNPRTAPKTSQSPGLASDTFYLSVPGSPGLLPAAPIWPWQTKDSSSSPSPRPTSLAPAPPPRPRRQVLRAPSPGPGQTPRAAGTAGRTEGAAAAFRTRGRPGAPARRPGARQAPDSRGRDSALPLRWPAPPRPVLTWSRFSSLPLSSVSESITTRPFRFFTIVVPRLPRRTPPGLPSCPPASGTATAAVAAAAAAAVRPPQRRPRRRAPLRPWPRPPLVARRSLVPRAPPLPAPDAAWEAGTPGWVPGGERRSCTQHPLLEVLGVSLLWGRSFMCCLLVLDWSRKHLGLL